MKALTVSLVLLVTSQLVQAQYLLTQPNKFVKNLKEGWWSEFNYSSLIDSTGEYYLEQDLHGTPKNVVAEGVYKKGEREGFWKEYWILPTLDSIRRLAKGGIKSITEFKEGVQCGLLIEYHKNGYVRALGRYTTYPVKDTVKIQVLDWRDPNFNTMKDTTIYIRARSRPIGIWQFFKSDGTAWNRMVYD